jgi:HD superfamily phosphohydrolase
MSKKILVSDILHYPISLTELERGIIATPIFNRLHNVKQNSTAFLTFPSLNHSRFSHSLGVMHLSGELIYYGLLNANQDDCSSLLKVVINVLTKTEKKFIPSRFRSLLNTEVPELHLRDPVKVCLRSPTLTPYVPYFLQKDQQFAFLITFQAIRLVSLIHDLGHPPFSHATEDAIVQIKEYLIKKDEGGNLSKKEKECSILLNAGPPIPPHEVLTQQLFEDLANEVTESVIQKIACPTALNACWLVLELTKLILTADFLKPDEYSEDERAALESLHLIVAGPLDADRLDYIQRDLQLSGIRTSAFRPQRLIELFELVGPSSHPQNNLPYPTFLFLPNVRAIRSLEEFFMSRYDLYRNVLYHHHVLKTNGLLQEIVRKMSLNWLSKDEQIGKENTTAQGRGLRLLSGEESDIEWLWKISEGNHHLGINLQNTLYLQWDDHWLMSLFRMKYIKLRERQRETEPLNTEDQILFKQLEDLVASKRNYVSIIKRLEDFHEIDLAFFEYIHLSGMEVNDLTERLRLKNSVAEKSDVSPDYLKKNTDDMIVKFSEKIEGFFEGGKEASYGAVASANKCLAVRSSSPTLESTIKNNFCMQADLLDALFVSKQINPGFTEDFMIQTTHGVKRFSDYSNVAREILNRENKMPAFYLYVLPSDPEIILNKNEIRNLLGRLLAQALLDSVNPPHLL